MCIELKKLWERIQNTSHFKQHFNLILKSVTNKLITFLDFKQNHKKCGGTFPIHYTPKITEERIYY